MSIINESLRELRVLEEIDPKDSQVHDITLEYKNLKFTIAYSVPAHYSAAFGTWDPPELAEDELTEDFDYDVDGDSVFEALCELFNDEDKRLALEEDHTDLSDGDEERRYDYIELHFNKLVERHLNDLKDYFEEDAKEAAEEYYEDESNFGPDPDYYYDSRE